MNLVVMSSRAGSVKKQPHKLPKGVSLGNGSAVPYTPRATGKTLTAAQRDELLAQDRADIVAKRVVVPPTGWEAVQSLFGAAPAPDPAAGIAATEIGKEMLTLFTEILPAGSRIQPAIEPVNMPPRLANHARILNVDDDEDLGPSQLGKGDYTPYESVCRLKTVIAEQARELSQYDSREEVGEQPLFMVLTSLRETHVVIAILCHSERGPTIYSFGAAINAGRGPLLGRQLVLPDGHSYAAGLAFTSPDFSFDPRGTTRAGKAYSFRLVDIGIFTKEHVRRIDAYLEERDRDGNVLLCRVIPEAVNFSGHDYRFDFWRIYVPTQLYGHLSSVYSATVQTQTTSCASIVTNIFRERIDCSNMGVADPAKCRNRREGQGFNANQTFKDFLIGYRNRSRYNANASTAQLFAALNENMELKDDGVKISLCNLLLGACIAVGSGIIAAKRYGLFGGRTLKRTKRSKKLATKRKRGVFKISRSTGI